MKSLADGPCVACGNKIFNFEKKNFSFEKKNLNLFLPITLPGHPWVSTNDVSPIGPAV